MNLSAAQTLAISLMTEHGLIAKGWRFEFSNARSQFGVCRILIDRHTKVVLDRVIKLSAPLTKLNIESEVKDTILHEIAHALAGHKAGHGWTWKAIARNIGAKPERCYKLANVAVPKSKLAITCQHCGAVIPCFRATKRIKKALTENEGKLTSYHVQCGRTLGRLVVSKA